MAKSRHTICSTGGSGSGDAFALNPLSGAVDRLNPSELAVLQGTAEPTESERAEMSERGYLVDADEENRRFKMAYLDFVDERDADEVQIFFVPTYGCNFSCDYCYQSEYGHPRASEAMQAVDAFFEYVDTQFAERRKYITLFGGEPLLPGAAHRELIERFIQRLVERNLELAVVTNGYFLSDYLELLTSAKLREIQVTLDGVGDVHNKRRPLHGGAPTFDAIVQGIDRAIERGVAINLRAVVDRDNADGLMDLARFAIDRGWTRAEGFKTQLGRNYELHACQAQRSRLFDRLELSAYLFEMLKEQPWMQEFIRPNFSVTKSLADTGELPRPLFDACPGCKTEWAFDISGGIYSCTATVGKADEKLGTFWPAVTLDVDAVAQWEDRDVLSIEECRSCNYQLLCGGGCASIAKNRHGKLHAPDCRPIGELLDMGMELYVTAQEENSNV